MENDGSYKPSEGGIREGAVDKFTDRAAAGSAPTSNVLRNTAYITWALASTSRGDTIGMVSPISQGRGLACPAYGFEGGNVSKTVTCDVVLFICLKNYICEFPANRLGGSFIVGMDPIGEKNNIDFGHRVADYGGSRVAGVAKRFFWSV